MNEKSQVVLITDASLDGNAKAGGWACYGSKEGNRIRYGAAFKTTKIWDINAAEMMAVINGLHFLKCAEMLERGDHVVIYTDSHNAISALTDDLAGGKYKHFKKMFEDEIGAGDHTFDLRYIKSHHRQKRREPKYQAHLWADLTARYHMQVSRLNHL